MEVLSSRNVYYPINGKDVLVETTISYGIDDVDKGFVSFADEAMEKEFWNKVHSGDVSIYFVKATASALGIEASTGVGGFAVNDLDQLKAEVLHAGLSLEAEDKLIAQLQRVAQALT